MTISKPGNQPDPADMSEALEQGGEAADPAASPAGIEEEEEEAARRGGFA